MSESNEEFLEKNEILDTIERGRLKLMDNNRKIGVNFEQFFSNIRLSRLMASFFKFDKYEVRILDPGAGMGTLFGACVENILKNKPRVSAIFVTAYEIDPRLFDYVRTTMKICKRACKKQGIQFEGELIGKDFIKDSLERLGLHSKPLDTFSHIITNPPYRKMSTKNEYSRSLRSLGLDNTNYYTSFLSIASKFLENSGQLVSITPRSFCNGPYFRSFRKQFLKEMSISRIHSFDSRSTVFREYKILQENIIIHAIKSKLPLRQIVISSNKDPDDENVYCKEVVYEAVILPGDNEKFIRIINNQTDEEVLKRMTLLQYSLRDLSLEVSTGKIVDFRFKNNLTTTNDYYHIPLIRPSNLKYGFVDDSESREYVLINQDSKKKLLDIGFYVIVKRLTSREEKRRIVASILDPRHYKHQFVALENRLNYYHKHGRGFELELAKGLAVYLNSSFVDIYFRQSNGNTQVNANDLRMLNYPSIQILRKMGLIVRDSFPSQQTIDSTIEKILFKMA